MFSSDNPAYLHFCPRPDRPADYDQQWSFVNEQIPGVAFLVGGNGAGCLGAEQPIYDPVADTHTPVSEIRGPFHVFARDASGQVVIAKADQPRIYGEADLYLVQWPTGAKMVVTKGHRYLTACNEWVEMGDAQPHSLSHWWPQRFSPFAGEMSYELPFSECKVEFLRHDVYWDFHVPVYENYWAAGVWNHNTTSCSLHKVVNFLMTQPPPRFDTPFWIIGESYDQICETAWKEKLNGQQFLPPSEVDYARITWLDSKADHPKAVPLLSWENRPGKNWMIEFKSYKQGRAEMQGRSIGGFCFVEQFPWSILREVHRGCREYHFPGSMMAEFTPIDPVLSIKLQEMQENQTLPEGWKVYRANTRCAMEAGHVDKGWYQQFFGSMDEAERAVREIGAWATFESQIYPTFNPLIHGITEAEVFSHEGNFPLNSHHFRAIDWGFSAEHAFVCLYGYRWGDSGDWVIYDEYFSTDQRRTVQDHLFAISSRWDWPADAHHHVTYADPSRPDCFRIAGRLGEYKDPETGNVAPPLSMANASNPVFPGIDHVRYMLTVNPGTGVPRLRICKERCPNLWRQMQTYRWKRGSDQGINPRAGQMEPVKMDDDAVDALRYLLFSEAKSRGATISQIARASRAAMTVPGVRG